MTTLIPIMLKLTCSGYSEFELETWNTKPKFNSLALIKLQETLPVSVRRLRVDDIDQVVAIEKEAFSPLWVSASFKRDLNNKRANYLVACFDEDVSSEEILAANQSDPTPTEDETPSPNLWSRVKGRFG